MVRPCFVDLINASWAKYDLNIKLEAKQLKIGNRVFEGNLNVNFDWPGIQCPTCRGAVQSTFRAEEANGWEMIKDQIKALAVQIHKDLGV